MSTKKESNVPAKADVPELLGNEFKALSLTGGKVAAILKNNMGAASVKPFDLDRIKVPTGGSQMWELPSLRGVQGSPVIEGIILHVRAMRSFWQEKYGSGQGNVPPDCTSTDLLRGVGKPGGDCQKCPFAQYGSAIDDKGQPGKGQACKESKLLLVMRQDDVVPLLIIVPPTSLKPAMKYLLRLANAGLPYQAVTTQFRLKGARNAGGIAYSEIDFSLGRELSQDEVQRAMEIAGSLQSLFGTITVQHDDLNG